MLQSQLAEKDEQSTTDPIYVALCSVSVQVQYFLYTNQVTEQVNISIRYM